MKAIQFERFGGPEVLELVDLPDPRPAAGQIRIKVRAVGVNPIDWKVRSGTLGGDLPRRTGLEVAGIVDEVGDGVTDVAVGDEVFGTPDGGGGAAELALMGNYRPIVEPLDFVCAAALPVAVETAARCLDLLGVARDQTLVINGAAGAVGVAAVQLARARGAHAIGTASPANHDYLQAFGAEATAYGDGMVERVRELAPDGVDRALDAAGHGALPALVELTGDPQHVITIADFAAAGELGVPVTGGPDAPRAWYALDDAIDLMRAGDFSMPVAHTFPLAEIGEAHRLSETGHVRGKLVLTIG
ncbi:MAG TPA: NADP-dependent oxidoreductase [Solirubrobacteraceae bacterium]|jgi:NADPH:quinone reductase-like Zn-dependent oxidoreductase|nr:NADP-dependent oxidoreductase [Solirubrobacteraceae bacterium]